MPTGVQLGSIFMPVYTTAVTPDAFGVRWKTTKIDGWFDGWEGSGTIEQKSQADGAWVSPQYAGPRVIHHAGSFEADSWDAATRAWDRLLAQLPFRQLATLLVSTGEGGVETQTSLVRQHEKPILNRHHTRGDFSLSLLAPDPRKYSATSRSVGLVLPLLTGGIAPPLTPPITITGSTSQSQATLTNDGNVDTYPTIMITGPCPPCTIDNLRTGERMRVLDAIPAGQSLVIDVLNGTATIDGQSRRVLGTWWALRPGANEVAFAASGYDAGAALSIVYRSAWK